MFKRCLKLKGSFKDVSRKFKECIQKVSRVFKEDFKGSFKSVSKKFHKKVLTKIEGGFKGI